MPLPTPTSGESKEDFISRCMVFQKDEGKLNLDDESERKQALAMCYSQFEPKTESRQLRTMKEIIKEGK